MRVNVSFSMDLKVIGRIESVFKYKNGTPRQSGICESSRAWLTIDKEIFNNPEHSLESLEQFSHIWYGVCTHFACVVHLAISLFSLCAICCYSICTLLVLFNMKISRSMSNFARML